MKILLDTHILLWWLLDDPKLTERARALVADRDNIVFLSAVTRWEIQIKKDLKKIEIPADFDDVVAEQGFEDLALNHEHLARLRDLPAAHRDPFDRMLIAQALAMGVRFLTADENCRAYGDVVEYVG
ncbi:MAG: type II toxin-antitoxin system VapC family toxin [Bryobacteraceae bacterium]